MKSTMKRLSKCESWPHDSFTSLNCNWSNRNFLFKRSLKARQQMTQVIKSPLLYQDILILNSLATENKDTLKVT